MHTTSLMLYTIFSFRPGAVTTNELIWDALADCSQMTFTFVVGNECAMDCSDSRLWHT